MFIKSIRARLIVAFCFGALLVIILAVNFTYSQVKKVLYSELDNFLRDKLTYQQIAAAQTEDRVVFRLSEPLLNAMQDPEGKDFFQFRYLNGREIFRSSGLPEDIVLPSVGLSDVDSSKGYDDLLSIESYKIEGDVNSQLIVKSVPIRCMGIVFKPVSIDSSDGELQSFEPLKVHLVVAHNCLEIEGVLSNLRARLLQVGVIVSMAVLLITALIVKISVKPVGLISKRISKLKIGEIGECIDLKNVPLELIPIIEDI